MSRPVTVKDVVGLSRMLRLPKVLVTAIPLSATRQTVLRSAWHCHPHQNPRARVLPMNAAAAKNRLTGHGGALQEGNADGSYPTDFGYSPCYGITGPRWYVAEAEYKKQHHAMQSLADEGYEAYLPVTLSMQRKRRNGIQGAPEPVLVPVMYQFLFVRFDAVEKWPSRSTCDGIKRIFLGMSQQPWPVSDKVIADLKADEVKRTKLPDKRMSRLVMGQWVKAFEGPWAGTKAEVVTCNGLETSVRLENGLIIRMRRAELRIVGADE